MNPLTTILSVPAVLAIVNLLKGAPVNLPTSWAAFTAVIVAVALNVAIYFLGANPAFVAAAQGMLIGLAAAGVYDVAKPAAPAVITNTNVYPAPLKK